mmetsp:Transcript_76655/g.148028  ORF Transcript_76655/g.148028 Transcript_76655/m.148028 type:complete len:214 (+) Transcript_76655:121-762(+)
MEPFGRMRSSDACRIASTVALTGLNVRTGSRPVFCFVRGERLPMVSPSASTAVCGQQLPLGTPHDVETSSHVKFVLSTDMPARGVNIESCFTACNNFERRLETRSRAGTEHVDCLSESKQGDAGFRQPTRSALAACAPREAGDRGTVLELASAEEHKGCRGLNGLFSLVGVAGQLADAGAAGSPTMIRLGCGHGRRRGFGCRGEAFSLKESSA